MAVDYFVLSNFGVRYFMSEYVDSDTVPGEGTAQNELGSIISCDGGAFTKENTKYRTLNSSGWESVAALGNTADDLTFECIREGTGAVYAGTDGTTTYQKIKNWFMLATSGAGESKPKCIVEVTPRKGQGAEGYEGTCYYVIPNQWSPGTRDTETGQEFSFTVTPFGPQTPLAVTYTPAAGETPEKFTFTKVQITDTPAQA